MGEPILTLTDVSKKYGKQEALKNVSLTVEPGRIVGLLGPNGSGKTTLIKIVNGLLLDYEGQVRICGTAPGTETKKLVSYLPDRLSLPDWLRVCETLAIYATFFADFDRPRAEGLLETLGVPQEKRIAQLSKGMKEKLQLTLTMARRAKLYILDEPIAGVDPAAREVIMNTILDNFAEESAILISTHIISDVEQVFDDIAFLKEGTLNLFGDAETLRQRNGKSVDQLFREVFRC